MNNSNTSQPPASTSTFNYGYVIVAVAVVVCMMNVGLFLSMGVFFKPISTDMGWTRADTSLPISLSSLITAIASILAGNLVDRYGPRRIAFIFGLFTSIGCLLMSRLSSLWEFYLYFGVLIGTGSCMMSPFLSLIPRWFTGRRTVMAGIIAGGGGIGGLIMPLFSNWLIDRFNWHQAFLVMGIIYVVLVLTAVQFLKRSPSVPPDARTSPHVAPQKTPPAPSFSLRQIFKSRNFWLLALMSVSFGFVANTVNLHSAPNATDIGISSTAAAGLLSVMNGVSILGSVFLGAMGDKFGNRKILLITFILEGAAMIWLISLRSMWSLNLFMIVYGLAFGSGLANIPSLGSRLFGTRSLGLILGIVSFCQTAGASLGGFVPGLIFDANHSYFWAFITCGSLCTLALIAALSLGLKTETGKA